MRRPAILALGLALGAGCVVTTRRAPPPGQPDPPSRWATGIGARGARVHVDDSLPDGADRSGFGFGMLGFAGYRLHPQVIGALALDVSVSSHDTVDPELDAGYLQFTWGLLVRAELPGSAVQAWGGWYWSDRTVDDGRGLSANTSTDLRGPGFAVAWLLRRRFREGPSIELGPFVQLAALRSVDRDDFGTPGREDEAEVRWVAVGLVFQIASPGR